MPRAAFVLWIAGLGAIAWVFLTELSGRAAFLHVGALLGTIMAGNVVFTIVPSQRELVRSVEAGRGGDPRVSDRAKRVSIHNNYLTFPVLVLMVSNHFPSLYGMPRRDLALVALALAGVAARHLLNIRFRWPAWGVALAATVTSLAIVLFGLTRISAPGSAPEDTVEQPATFAEVRHIIDRRCAPCHSARPTDLTFGPAPGGVRYDTPDQIVASAARIRERAVITRTMPPGNKTGISDAERAVLGRWIAAGASTAAGQLPR